jgi:membrane-associated phospholipid phosphatase
MKKILISNRIFFLSYSCWLIIAFALSLFYSQPTLSMYINNFRFPWSDFFASYITHFGDGLFAVFVSVLCLLINRKIGLLIILSYLFSAAITQTLKHTIFADAGRPIQFFQQTNLVHFIEGVTMHSHNSFPSGHTTSVFALCSMLSLCFQKSPFQVLFFLIALTAGLTRVYLLQHYLIDVIAGSFIGVLSSILLYYWLKDKAIFSIHKQS